MRLYTHDFRVMNAGVMSSPSSLSEKEMADEGERVALLDVIHCYDSHPFHLEELDGNGRRAAGAFVGTQVGIGVCTRTGPGTAGTGALSKKQKVKSGFQLLRSANLYLQVIL